MKGMNCSMAMGFGLGRLSDHMFLAVPAEDSCATIGCIVVEVLDEHLQLHWAPKAGSRRYCSSPSRRSAMLSMELSESPKNSLEVGADVD
jgi:hypothetical protein